MGSFDVCPPRAIGGFWDGALGPNTDVVPVGVSSLYLLEGREGPSFRHVGSRSSTAKPSFRLRAHDFSDLRVVSLWVKRPSFTKQSKCKKRPQDPTLPLHRLQVQEAVSVFPPVRTLCGSKVRYTLCGSGTGTTTESKVGTSLGPRPPLPRCLVGEGAQARGHDRSVSGSGTCGTPWCAGGASDTPGGHRVWAREGAAGVGPPTVPSL